MNRAEYERCINDALLAYDYGPRVIFNGRAIGVVGPEIIKTMPACLSLARVTGYYVDDEVISFGAYFGQSARPARVVIPYTAILEVGWTRGLPATTQTADRPRLALIQGGKR